MTQKHRLEGHGQQPTDAELEHLSWPHNMWWSDRDRIVLLHEFISHWQPDGSFEWESLVTHHAADLWSAGRPGSTTLHRHGCNGQPKIDEQAKDVAEGRMCWDEFQDLAAPGWRMLSSLPSCPNPHMRFPMSRDLLDAVRRGAEDRRAAYVSES